MIIPLLGALLLAIAPLDDKVLEEGRAALEALEGARAKAEQLLERNEAEGRRLAELLEVVSRPLPALPPEIETYPDEGSEELRVRFEAWRDHLALLEQWAAAPDEARQRPAVQAKPFEELQAATRTLAEAVDAAGIALKPVDEAVAGAKLTAGRAATALGLEELSSAAKKVEQARALAEALPERIAASREAEDAVLAGLLAVEAPDAELLRQATVQRDASEILMSIVILEQGERDRLVKEGQDGLQAALDEALEDFGAVADLEQLKAEAKRDWEALEEFERLRTDRKPPVREDFAEGEGHAELRETRRELAWAEAMLAFRRESLELLESRRASLTSLLEQMISGADLVRTAGGALVRVRSAVQARAKLTDPDGQQPIEYPEVGGQEIWAVLKPLLATEAQRAFAQEELERLLAKTDLEDAAATTLEAQLEAVDRARHVFEEEEAYASLVEEMTRLTDEALILELEPGGSAVVALEAAHREEAARRQVLAELEATLPAIVDRVAQLDTPYAQKQISKHPGRGEEIREELKALAGQEKNLLPNDTSDLKSRWESTRPSSFRSADPPVEEVNEEVGEEAGEEELLSPSKAQLRALRVAQRAAQERLRYFLDLDALVVSLRAASDEFQASVEAVRVALAAHLSLERRLSAASRELRRRRRLGLLAEVQVPAKLATARTREEITGIVAERKALAKKTDETRAILRAELARQELFLSWKEWAEIGGEVAQQNNNLISQPVTHVESARKKVEELRDFERGNLEYTAQQMALEERSRLEKVLAPLAKPERRERFEATLDAYYLELVNLDRVMEEYEKAQEAYAKLIEINQRHREQLGGAVEAMQQVEKTRFLEYQEVRAFAGIAANPSRRIRIAAEYAQQQGRELSKLIDDQGWDSLYWADSLVAAEARLWGDRAWIANLVYRLSRAGIESEINAFRTHIAHIGTEIEEGEELRDKLRRRIEELRSGYQNDLQGNAMWTLLKILLIPILAILAVRGLSRGARKFRTKARGEIGSPDRQRRLETLTNVTTASIRVVVWVIAGIYILGFLGLDITPIIASASVVGLAVAFGAQALVKDFFAGFFLLLEHQYSVGDVVDLGMASGTVEHISLRMTTLRDLQGTVHYVPNGLVQRVANKTKGWSRIVMEVGVAYGEDVDRVTEVLREVLVELREDQDQGPKIIEEPSVAGVQALGESRIDVRLMVKVLPGEQWAVARDLRSRIKRRFDAEGIKAPYPHRVIHQLAQEDREK